MTSVIKVLLIDDSVTVRAMMMSVLEADPEITVTAVSSADEADEVLARSRFHVVTLDVEMPRRGGMEYLLELVNRHRVPTIMLSASTGKGALTRTLADVLP